MTRPIFTRGQEVYVRQIGSQEWTTARVAIVSENQLSITLELDGMIRLGDGIAAGTFPLAADDADSPFHDLFYEGTYEIEIKHTGSVQ